MPVLNYIPQFIPKQYVPMNDIGLIGSIIGKKEQEYNTALDAQNKSFESLYDIRTVNSSFEETKRNIANELGDDIDELVKRRGGDYGAALPDIVSRISKIKDNPFFRLNEQQLQQADLLERARAANPNLKILRDPTSIEYNPNLTKEDLQYQILDPEEVRKTSRELLSFMDEKALSDIRTDSSGYDVASFRRGPTDENIALAKQDPGIRAKIMTQFPQLKYMDANERENFITEHIEAAALSYRKDPEENILGFNPYRRVSLIDNDNKFNTYSETVSIYTPDSQDENVRPGIYKQATENYESISQLGIDKKGNIKKPDKHLGPTTIQKIIGQTEEPRKYYDPSGYGYKGPRSVTSEYKDYEKFNKYKEDYSTLYEHVRNTNGNDLDFLETVTNIEKNKSFVLTSVAGFNNPKFTQNLINNLYFSEAQFTKLNKDLNPTDKKLSMEDYSKKFDNVSGFSFKDSKVFISPKGQLILQDPHNDKYELNKESLPDATRKYLTAIEDTFDAYYDYSLSKDRIDLLNGDSGWFKLGANIHTKVFINNNNPLDKKLLISLIDPQTQQQKIGEFNNPTEFFEYISNLINADTFRGK